MSIREFRSIASTQGISLAALMARLNKVPLAQVQLWLRSIQSI